MPSNMQAQSEPLPSSPSIQRVPIELLGEAFAVVLSSTISACDIPDTLAGLNLVCKAWRDASIATPRLWSHLGIDLRERIDFEQVSRWLSKAGSAPKSLTAYTGTGCDHSNALGCPVAEPRSTDFLKMGPSFYRLSIHSQETDCYAYLSTALKTMVFPTSTPTSLRSWTFIKYIGLYVSEFGSPTWLPLLSKYGDHLVAASLHVDQALTDGHASAMKDGLCIKYACQVDRSDAPPHLAEDMESEDPSCHILKRAFAAPDSQTTT